MSKGFVKVDSKAESFYFADRPLLHYRFEKWTDEKKSAREMKKLTLFPMQLHVHCLHEQGDCQVKSL